MPSFFRNFSAQKDAKIHHQFHFWESLSKLTEFWMVGTCTVKSDSKRHPKNGVTLGLTFWVVVRSFCRKFREKDCRIFLFLLPKGHQFALISYRFLYVTVAIKREIEGQRFLRKMIFLAFQCNKSGKIILCVKCSFDYAATDIGNESPTVVVNFSAHRAIFSAFSVLHESREHHFPCIKYFKKSSTDGRAGPIWEQLAIITSKPKVNSRCASVVSHFTFLRIILNFRRICKMQENFDFLSHMQEARKLFRSVGSFFFFFQSKNANSFCSETTDSSGVRTTRLWSGRSGFKSVPRHIFFDLAANWQKFRFYCSHGTVGGTTWFWSGRSRFDSLSCQVLF